MNEYYESRFITAFVLVWEVMKCVLLLLSVDHDEEEGTDAPGV